MKAKLVLINFKLTESIEAEISSLAKLAGLTNLNLI
jgi:hypothetical protein